MANHPCPSCGFVHASEGNEVPAIVVEEMRAPSFGDVKIFLRGMVERFNLSLDHRVSDVLNAIEESVKREAEPAAVKSISACPVCVSQGFDFVTDSIEEFNAHMTASQHGKPVEPELHPPTPEEIAAAEEAARIAAEEAGKTASEQPQ